MKSRCEPVIAKPIRHGDTGPVADNIVRTWLSGAGVRMSGGGVTLLLSTFDSVNQLANLSDAELIASSPSIQT